MGSKYAVSTIVYGLKAPLFGLRYYPFEQRVKLFNKHHLVQLQGNDSCGSVRIMLMEGKDAL